ncbi:MAG: STAS domain-containing protein [Leptospiraceae bacterium]|nr:STAS domain-containing protein [Leptospiraceae bacterium]
MQQKTETFFQIKKYGRTVVVSITGKLGMLEAPEISDAIEKEMGSNVDEIIIDCSSLFFIDSSGVGKFISLVGLANKKNIDFLLVGLSNSLETVFKLARLNKIIKILNREEQFKKRGIPLK